MEVRGDREVSDGTHNFKDFSNPEVALPAIGNPGSGEDATGDVPQSAAVQGTAWGRLATTGGAVDGPSIRPKFESTDGQEAMGTADALEAEAPTDDEALRGRTENDADTYTSSGSACVDFFFKVVRGMDCDEVGRLLAAAWAEDADTALRLVFHLRDVREGKGEQAAFYACLRWLRGNHPRTLIANLRHVAAVGYWKDLLELVVLEGVGSRTGAAKGRPRDFRKGKPIKRARVARGKKSKDKRWRGQGKRKEPTEEEKEAKETRRGLRREMRLAKMQGNRRCARESRALAARAAFESDEVYQAIHVEVARLFATALRADLEKFRAGKGVSLAAKWAPSLECSHDRRSHISSTIACMLFPREEEGMRGKDWGSYVYRARDRYRKEVLVPLRRHLDVTEVKMSDGAWGAIDYGRVASVCMNANKGHFAKHDGERFAAYLGEVKKGKAKIAAGALMPHELVQQVMRHGERAMVAAALGSDDEDVGQGEDLCMETVELQWKAYVSRLRGAGVLDGALAICDVSGSMECGGEAVKPLEVAVALSLLVSEVTEPPFGGLVCTFSSEPELVSVRLEDSLADKVRDMRGMNWGGSTDLEAVFDLILARALASGLHADRMIRRLFVFSDMEFDQAQDGGDHFESTHAVAKRRFLEAGYALPQVVYWNLSGRFRMGGRGASTPVLKEEEGCSLISGFSGQLLKAFMGEGGLDKFRPHSMMMAAVQRYGHLVVLD
eukprot:evm.model.scf_576.4 EVM.evm.TU.scf_576.4   scf_576:21094-23265(+)